MPAIYISKYNRFVDNILGRVNKILRKSYDPVRVRLQSPVKNTKSNKKGNKKNKKNKNQKPKTGRNLNGTETEYVLVSTTANHEDKMTTQQLMSTVELTTQTTPEVKTTQSTAEVVAITTKTTKNPVANRATKRRKSTKRKSNKGN